MEHKRPTVRNTTPAASAWDEVHHRLDQARTSLELGKTPTSEEVRKILKTRANTLAQEDRERTTAEDTLEVVAFLLGNESYALESIYIREVQPLRELTPLPGTPPFVLGIINLRGQIVSVITIKKFFDLPERGLTTLDKVIVIGDGRMEFGILADAILGVRSLPLAIIQPSLPTLTGVRQEYLKGITSEGLVILDAGKLLSDPKIIVHEAPEG